MAICPFAYPRYVKFVKQQIRMLRVEPRNRRLYGAQPRPARLVDPKNSRIIERQSHPSGRGIAVAEPTVRSEARTRLLLATARAQMRQTGGRVKPLARNS